MVLEKTLESPLDCKENKPVKPKGNQTWIFIGRTDAEAEAPILWLADAKCQLIGKDHDAGKDWRQKEKEAAEDEMVRQHHWLNEHESEETWRDMKDREDRCVAVHGLQRVRHDLTTKQQQQKYKHTNYLYFFLFTQELLA